MKGNGFDEEDFYITFFALWSLGVLVVALWSIFLDLKLRRNNRRLTKTVKDQRVNKTVGGCAYPLRSLTVFGPACQGLCRPVGHAGPIQGICGSGRPDAEDATQLFCARYGRYPCARRDRTKASMMSLSNPNTPNISLGVFRERN